MDVADGFIHFSTAEQAAETGRRHFRGQSDLMVLIVDATSLGEALKWEASRGGALFPHLHAALDCASVIAARPVALGSDGTPDLGGIGQ